MARGNAEAGDIVEAQVTGVNKGGLELKVNNARAFMPAGQVDTKFNADLSMFLNQRFTCMVTKVDREDQNIILSRRETVGNRKKPKRASGRGASWRWGRFAKAPFAPCSLMARL